MKILVVEDEHKIGTAIKKGLEQERHVVDVAFTGETGQDLALSEEYDLIILDLMLPDIDGLTICKEVRKNNIHTPILNLTAKGQTQDKVEGLDAGADDYLTKPFSFEELLARIRALARRPIKNVDEVLKYDDLRLSPKLFKVTRGKKQIDLSSKEFSLLEFLLRNQNQVLTKDQIMSHVWSYDDDILPNTIEVFIRNLRLKIEVPFKGKKPIIKTLRGFGYKIGS